MTDGKDIIREKAVALAQAADEYWTAILRKDLPAFAAYQASFNAQTAMFPGMVHPTVDGQLCPEAGV
ncbi:hypothetical protein [Bacteroides sp.]|uniref:hypothetical protein n=1 Tax=Bacteroides sp. TaxID=29523 RepID=UPI0023CC389D|nr:hypothetical protein [Bacteroides sp.]MDE5710559.1 hypothetical protein [Bacteroides sp.]MDE6215057.1 hypothetical protein [Bacteroides sp.]